MKLILARFPPRHQIFPVFSLTVFLVYSWAIALFLWTLPRWIISLSVLDISAIAAYVMSVALLDSVLITGWAILLAVVLPARLIRDDFPARGGALALGIFLCSVFYQSAMWNLLKMGTAQVILLIPLTLTFLVLLIYATARLVIIRRAFLGLADRSTVFLMIYLPLSCLSLLVVIFRNI